MAITPFQVMIDGFILAYKQTEAHTPISTHLINEVLTIFTPRKYKESEDENELVTISNFVKSYISDKSSLIKLDKPSLMKELYIALNRDEILLEQIKDILNIHTDDTEHRKTRLREQCLIYNTLQQVSKWVKDMKYNRNGVESIDNLKALQDYKNSIELLKDEDDIPYNNEDLLSQIKMIEDTLNKSLDESNTLTIGYKAMQNALGQKGFTRGTIF